MQLADIAGIIHAGQLYCAGSVKFFFELPVVGNSSGQVILDVVFGQVDTKSLMCLFAVYGVDHQISYRIGVVLAVVEIVRVHVDIIVVAEIPHISDGHNLTQIIVVAVALVGLTLADEAGSDHYFQGDAVFVTQFFDFFQGGDVVVKCRGVGSVLVEEGSQIFVKFFQYSALYIGIQVRAGIF